ncbi:CLUMA_CG019222, isoform A [Clunio marinus]|uniref:CLUMA_CG019222, isoform A n=1 Tax=Clunio marinus TaxID=568069 RepID=A0A1J1J0I9_9DIPT|nr:CLUMA_CG019222, isoform A [Clunio marinus]
MEAPDCVSMCYLRNEAIHEITSIINICDTKRYAYCDVNKRVWCPFKVSHESFYMRYDFHVQGLKFDLFARCKLDITTKEILEEKEEAIGC